MNTIDFWVFITCLVTITSIGIVEVMSFFLFLRQICGLQLEGCSFDGTRLMESQRDSPSVSTIPPCVVAWVTKESPSPYNLAECISLPLYYSSDRYKLVTCLDVPSGSRSNKMQWIQSGVALFLKN